MPALRVSEEKLLLPPSTTVPDPFWTSSPDPVMPEAKPLPWVIVSCRLKISLAEAVSEIALAGLSEPLVPPFPSCRAPAVTLVAPE